MLTLKRIFCCWVVFFGLVTCSGAEEQEVVILSSLDEPMRFLVGAADKASAEEIRKEIKKMKKSGEFDKIVARMRLE